MRKIIFLIKYFYINIFDKFGYRILIFIWHLKYTHFTVIISINKRANILKICEYIFMGNMSYVLFTECVTKDRFEDRSFSWINIYFSWNEEHELISILMAQEAWSKWWRSQ